MKMASLNQFIVCSNLVSKLDKSCYKEAIYILELGSKKMLKKQFLGTKIHFFQKRNVT